MGHASGGAEAARGRGRPREFGQEEFSGMIKTLSKSIREFKKPAILTPILVVGEVILECIIRL